MKRSEVERHLVAKGLAPSRNLADRAVELALSNLSSTLTEAELFRKLRGNGYAKAADMAAVLYPFALEERARRRDPSYLNPASVQKLADAIAGFRRTLDRLTPASKPPTIAPGWHITKENRAKLIAEMQATGIELRAGLTYEDLADAVFKRTTPDMWR